MRGNETWATLIALQRDAETVVGVASAPAMRLRFHAILGEGAFLNGRRIQCLEDLGDLRGAHHAHRDPGIRHHQAIRTARRPRRPLLGCPRHRQLDVASRGRAGHRRHRLDVAGEHLGLRGALKLIVTEAGGRFTDRSGDDPVLGGTGISSNGLLHDLVLDAAGYAQEIEMRIGTIRDGIELLPALIEGDRAYRLDDVLGAMGGAPVAVPDGADAATVLATRKLAAAARAAAASLPDLIARGAAPSYPLYSLGPPVPRPGKIVCAGRNYADHASELGEDIPSQPILFAKLATSIRGPFDDVVRPLEVDDLDYEAELCVVIGTGGRRIPRNARSPTSPATAAQTTSRRATRNSDSATSGCAARASTPSVRSVPGSSVQTRSRIRRHWRCAAEWTAVSVRTEAPRDMIFDVATLISYISDAFTLEPGDLILTGTPAGVAVGQNPPPWLQPGQLCEVEIPEIGVIANRIVAEGQGSTPQ